MTQFILMIFLHLQKGNTIRRGIILAMFGTERPGIIFVFTFQYSKKLFNKHQVLHQMMKLSFVSFVYILNKSH